MAEKEKKLLHQLELEKIQSIEPKINDQIYKVLTPEKSISRKKSLTEELLLRKFFKQFKEQKKRFRKHENINKNYFNFFYIY